MEHSRCFTHRNVVVSWEQHSLNTKQGTTVERRLDRLGQRVIQDNRHYLKAVAEVILLSVLRLSFHYVAMMRVSPH